MNYMIQVVNDEDRMCATVLTDMEEVNILIQKLPNHMPYQVLDTKGEVVIDYTKPAKLTRPPAPNWKDPKTRERM